MAFLPIVERELRVAARRPGTYRARWLVAGAGVLLWFCLVFFGQRNASMQSLGQSIFVGLGALTFAYALLTGLFLTADCLCSEKREGTLGLLLLANLRPLEIILGKLAANSLQGVCGVITMLPLLALPLLLGGVTGGAWGRLCLSLLITLFFSLSAGILASLVCRETHHAMLLTLLILVVFAGFCPATAWILIPRSWPEYCRQLFVIPSPGFLLYAGRQYHYGTHHGPLLFWASAGAITTLGMAFLALAVALIKNGWLARGLAAGWASIAAWLAQHDGTLAQLTQQRATLLTQNPVYWLAARDRTAGRLAWFPVAAMGLVVAIFAIAAQLNARTHGEIGKYLAFSSLLAYLAHQVYKLLVALEATRQMAEDRATGHWELFLISPLSEQQLLAGQLAALRSQFRPSERALATGNFILFLLFLFCSHSLSINGQEFPVFIMAAFGGLLALWLDAWSLRWVGLWQSLRAPTRYRAVFATVLRTLAPVWLGLFFMVFLTYSSNPSSKTINFAVFSWLLCGQAYVYLCGKMARLRLLQSLRQKR